MSFRGLIKRGKRGSEYTDAISTRYADVNNSWLVMWHDQILRVLDTREEAEHYATQLTTEGVVPLHPLREERERKRREQSMKKTKTVFEEALDIMGSDPGFIEAARGRELQAKKDRLQFGRQLFRRFDNVTHVDSASYPWVGLVRKAEYEEQGIDGPGWYYEVGWLNEKLNQYHEDYLHQDFLRPL